MKLFKRSGEYRASNLSFDPETGIARSYGHWHLTRKVGNIIYLNIHPYSKTTVRHIAKVRDLLDQLGIRYLPVSTAVNLRALDFEVAGAVLDEAVREVEDAAKLIESSRKGTAIALTRQANLNRLMTLIDNLADMRAFLNTNNAKDDLIIYNIGWAK